MYTTMKHITLGDIYIYIYIYMMMMHNNINKNNIIIIIFRSGFQETVLLSSMYLKYKLENFFFYRKYVFFISYLSRYPRK